VIEVSRVVPLDNLALLVDERKVSLMAITSELKVALAIINNCAPQEDTENSPAMQIGNVVLNKILVVLHGHE
jgi:hypothetical protein